MIEEPEYRTVPQWGEPITEITGDLSINSSAKLEALTSVGGDLYPYGTVSAKIEKKEILTSRWGWGSDSGKAELNNRTKA